MALRPAPSHSPQRDPGDSQGQGRACARYLTPPPRLHPSPPPPRAAACSDAHAARPVGESRHVSVARQAPRPAHLPPALRSRLQHAGLRRDWRYPASNQRYLDQGGFLAAAGLAWDVDVGPGMRVSAAQLQHRVPCWGYVFQEQQDGGSGDGGSDGGGGHGRKVVLLGDTMDSLAIAPLALGADVLSHEATFREGMEATALRAQHSTAWMAGEFAAAVGARALVLTHFSARYHGLDWAAAAGSVQAGKKLQQQHSQSRQRAVLGGGGGGLRGRRAPPRAAGGGGGGGGGGGARRMRRRSWSSSRRPW